jgi:hypothetical protein
MLKSTSVGVPVTSTRFDEFTDPPATTFQTSGASPSTAWPRKFDCTPTLINWLTGRGITLNCAGGVVAEAVKELN